VTILSTKIKANSATFRFAEEGDASSLQCALVRSPSGPHGRKPKPAYSACGSSRTYRHLAKGSYTLYVRALAPGAIVSVPVTRRLKIT
jgi:hypothetical protein